MQFMIIEVEGINGVEVYGNLKGVEENLNVAEELRKKENNDKVWVIVDYLKNPNT